MRKIFPALLFLLIFSACANEEISDSRNSPQKKFGEDSKFFVALKAIDEGNEKEAVRNFKISRKKGSSYISRRSAESLTLFGSVKERIEAAKYLAQNFSDEESLLFACRELSRDGEFSEVIALTKNIDIEYSENELVRIRLESLLEKNDSNFESEFYRWMISRPLSAEHLFLYQKYLDFKEKEFSAISQSVRHFQDKLDKRSREERELLPFSDGLQDESEALHADAILSLDDETPVSAEQFLFDYRIQIHRKNYLLANTKINDVFELYKKMGEEPDDQLLSDIGKAALYGTFDFLASAKEFDRIAGTLSKPKSYYAYFYAARLYDKAGRYQNQVVSRYKAALSAAETSLQFDNCLWYLLNFQLRTSTDDIIKTLTEYGSMISDAEYFDDFFESLSVLFLSNHKWQDFYEVWMKTNSNFSETIAGKFAYISGRLIEEGLAEGEEGLKTRQTVDAFTKVLSGGGDLYYKLLALERLNIFDDKIVENTLLVKGKDVPVADGDEAAGILLDGYQAFGFPQSVYKEWLNYRKSLSVKDSITAAKFLNSCASLDEKNLRPEYSVQSLRIAARCYAMSYGRLPKELLELSFPRFYKNQIESVCEENGLPEYLMYALVRSESFFDAGVKSSAGAAGLTQLMEATAKEEAAKLKMFNYDIFNPSDNLRIGAHYFASLISRAEDNSVLLALFAYNAGFKNVKRFLAAAKKDWANYGKTKGKAGIEMDLFLETLPFSETREYGRKLVTAASIYGWLYENQTPIETVRLIMK